VLGLALCAGLAVPSVRGADKDPPKAGDKGLEGIWQGTLKIGNVELRLAFKVTKKDDKLTATLDSIDQGAKDIPVDSVEQKDATVTFTMAKLKASFEGTMNKEGTEIAGTFKQAGMEFPLTLKRTDKVAELARPQEPKKPYPYDAVEVTYENKKGGAKFAGTLTLPKGDGPFPVVLLITGSGPQDRDETVAGHKPFLILADHLTRKGVAVLRVDDRGVGGSTGDTEKATSEDFAGDVLAGVEFLKGRKEIDPKRIGLVGHSEGGMIAPMVAAQSKDVAFIVLLAGPGQTGEDLLLLQGELVVKSEGGDADAVKKARAQQEALFGILKKEKDPKAAKEKVDAYVKEQTEKLTDEERKQLEALKAVQEAKLNMLLTPWFRYFLEYDPAPALKKVRCPVLAVNGEKDVQVSAKENLARIKKSLEEGGNPDVTVKELPGLNHLLQTCKTGAVSEYTRIEETMAPAALEVISDWILAHVKAGK
jgi:fermentation-respiration switch protein FrsA (DUF1100 family)